VPQKYYDTYEDAVRNLGYAWLQLGALAALVGGLVYWLTRKLEEPPKKKKKKPAERHLDEYGKPD
jgi:hypothetical protein